MSQTQGWLSTTGALEMQLKTAEQIKWRQRKRERNEPASSPVDPGLSPAGGTLGTRESPPALGEALGCPLPHCPWCFPLPRRYVVVSPAVLYHPHTGTVSVHLSDLNETVRVSVRLERGDGPSAIPLLEREVQEPRLHENVRFQVPAPSGGRQDAAELHVSIRGDALHFSERKKVLLQALEPGALVQTDKAVYKPGQTVKFRIVSLDKDFIPSPRKLPLVTLQDPSGNRIAQWRDVTPQQGIVDLSLPLSAEPALGTYAIQAQGTRHSFSVEEYGGQRGPGQRPRPRVQHMGREGDS
nr:alpha-2-macroglobulin-like protein 1 [Caretta caretta]